ncbi:hypothetical protein EOL70_13370 [Leucothrix sargassi]|nr:hypothetical protein EOL70_13370 [Leucothrix sargassi]
MSNDKILDIPAALIARALNGDEVAKREILETLAEEGISPLRGKPARVMDALDDLQEIYQQEV